jgi:hypothetical protein
VLVIEMKAKFDGGNVESIFPTKHKRAQCKAELP